MKYLKDNRIIKGSLQEKRLKCGNAGCHCHKKGGIGHGPYSYVAVVMEGKTRPFLLKKGDVSIVKRHINRYKELRREVEQVTKKNIQLLRQGRLK